VVAKAKKGRLHLVGSSQVPALISWLHGWQAAEKHYFKGKKPPGNMSDLIEKRVLGELQALTEPNSVRQPRKRRPSKTANNRT
jgi:hypothetical protein